MDSLTNHSTSAIFLFHMTLTYIITFVSHDNHLKFRRPSISVGSALADSTNRRSGKRIPERSKKQNYTMLFREIHIGDKGFPGGIRQGFPACQCRRCKRHGFNSWVRKIASRRAWQPLQYSFLENAMDCMSMGSQRVGHD